MLSKDLSQTKKKEKEGSEKKDIKYMKLTLTPLMLCLGLMKTPNQNRSVLNGCRLVLGYVLKCFRARIGFEKFLYKGNVGVLGEMMSKFSKTHVFVLVITWLLLIQIELFKFLGKLDL